MIYTLSWLPSITLLGVVMLFLIVTVLAVAAVLAAAVVVLAILLALAFLMVRSSVVLVRAAWQRLPRLDGARERALEPTPRPAPLVNPQLHRVR